MRFDVCGGFEIERQPRRQGGVFNDTFWTKMDASNDSLSGACGCYIFALRNGDNIVAWYVGKTEKLTFKKECFQPTKISYYNGLLKKHNGVPILILLPRLTGSGKKFSKPTKRGYRDIDFLETLLIGMALEQNANLLNVQKTKLLREMVVPGLINTKPGPRTGPVQALRNALGM